MSGGEMFVLAFVLLFFGGLSGAFVFVCVRLIIRWLGDNGFYVDAE